MHTDLSVVSVVASVKYFSTRVCHIYFLFSTTQYSKLLYGIHFKPALLNNVKFKIALDERNIRDWGALLSNLSIQYHSSFISKRSSRAVLPNGILAISYFRLQSSCYVLDHFFLLLSMCSTPVYAIPDVLA